MEQVVHDQAPRGSVIQFSPAEVNALVRGAILEKKISGIREPRVTLGVDEGTWTGWVDFEKLPQLAKLRQSFLLSSILKGESRIEATLTLVSGGGMATVDVKRVSIGESSFEGRTLGFLVQSVMLSGYPNIELGKPFALEHNIERIQVAPTGVRVEIRR